MVKKFRPEVNIESPLPKQSPDDSSHQIRLHLFFSTAKSSGLIHGPLTELMLQSFSHYISVAVIVLLRLIGMIESPRAPRTRHRGVGPCEQLVSLSAAKIPFSLFSPLKVFADPRQKKKRRMSRPTYLTPRKPQSYTPPPKL